MAGYNFGAFKGVFTPSILTILGVVMYLRFGWVLGNVGLPLTLLIAAMSCLITFFTGLAIAALASNTKVGIGGAYFIISRSLGLEIGAAIGIPLLLAQTLGISFYIAGFSESIVNMWPLLDPVVVGVGTLIILTVVALISANIAMRMQFFILVAIALSLVSFFMGSETIVAETAKEISPVPFWAAFAVFFPAVTGIEAGISMSGDLKEPGRDLSRGTLGAVIVGFVVYMAIPIFLTWRVDSRFELINNPLIMRDVARFGDAILVGIWGASISSALGAILGAPRTLQALAIDRVVPQKLGKTYGKTRDPRLATGVTFCVALAGVVLGDLNMIAPILAMFFLTSYGLLNFSAAMEAAIGSPSWRPALRLHWIVHLLGALACFGAMVMINAFAAFSAAVVSTSVYIFMKRRHMKANWGDVRYGMAMGMIQRGVYELAGNRPDLKSWRPNVLAFVGSPQKRWNLVDFAYAISQGHGFMTLAAVVTLPKGKDSADSHARKIQETLETYLAKTKIKTLVKTFGAENISIGMQSLVGAYGYGPIEPNTIMIGGQGGDESLHSYVDLIFKVVSTEKNLVIVRDRLDSGGGAIGAAENRVDIWWGGKGENSGLMLALVKILEQNESYDNYRFVLKTLYDDKKERDKHWIEKVSARLKEFTEVGRLEVETELVQVESEKSRLHTIAKDSRHAALTMLGLRFPEEDESKADYEKYLTDLMTQVESLPLVVFVVAAEDMPFKNLFQGL